MSNRESFYQCMWPDILIGLTGLYMAVLTCMTMMDGVIYFEVAGTAILGCGWYAHRIRYYMNEYGMPFDLEVEDD